MNSHALGSLHSRLPTVEPDQPTTSQSKAMRLVSRTCWLIVPAVTLFVIGATFLDIRTYSGDDLRNRVVGARVMLAGYDPYVFVWQPDMPERWLDPVYDAKAPRLTASPPTLLLYAIIAPFSFATQRLISFIFEWLALVTSVALLTRSLPDVRCRTVFLLGTVFSVIATDVWRLHIERGQMYVFVLLALSVAIAWSRRGQVDSIVAGIAFGVAALLQPNLLVIAPALVILRQWRSSGAMLATLGAGVAATMLMLPMSSWRNYLDVGDQYFRAYQDPQSVPNRARPLYEGPVEGVQFCNSLRNIESSCFSRLYSELRNQFDWPTINLALTSKALLMGLAALLLVLMWRRRGDACCAFAPMVILTLDTGFFLPQRWGYVDVLLLAPLALLLPALLRADKINRLLLGVVLLGLLSGPLGQHIFGLYAATVLRSWVVMGGLTILSMRSCEAAHRVPPQDLPPPARQFLAPAPAMIAASSDAC